MSSQMDNQEPEQEERVYITLEDKIVCEGCIKADVCEVLKSVIRLGSYAQNFEDEFNVKVNLSASIYECEHRVSNEQEIGVDL